MKITYTPAYIHQNKFSMSTNEPHAYQLKKNKNPVKLVEPHSNTFNKMNNFNIRNKNNNKIHYLTNSQGKNLDYKNNINHEIEKPIENTRRNFKKFLNKNLSPNNTGALTNADSKIFNSRVIYSDDNNNNNNNNNNIISSTENNSKQINNINNIRNHNQKEIIGLNYQDLVNIVNRRKLMLEKKNNNLNKYNQENNNKDDNAVQTSLEFQNENKINNNNIDNFPIMEDKKENDETEILIKEKEKNNDLFSSISSINSNLKTVSKNQKLNNKNKENNNLINSSEFDVVNTDNDYKITKNEVTLNTETDFNIENNTELKELIDLNGKDDFKIEHNPENGGNSIFQDKTSLFESMINPNLQQSKSLISLTQKNDIEVTQVEEYDQEKYRQQNETKEINFSTLLNTTPNNIDNISPVIYNSNNKQNNINYNQNENNKIDSRKDTLKTQLLEEKMNFFEETIQQYPKKQIKDKINEIYINQNSKRSLFENLPQEPIILGKMELSNNNNRYENYYQKDIKKISNSKIVNQMNQNFNIKSPQHINEKLKIPLPQKSSEYLFSNNNKKINNSQKKKNNINLNLHGNNPLSQRKNKFNNYQTHDTELNLNRKKLNHSDGNKKFCRSCSKNNYNSNKKKTRKIENYSDYYKKKADLITKEETKSPNEEKNKIDNNNCLNKSMEMNNILVINVNNSNPKNNLFYKLQSQKNNNSSRGTLSENSKDKIGKHNKSTYY